MIDAFSTPRNKRKSFAFLGIFVILAITSAIIGIDDNPPGVLLALFAAIAGVFAFVHPWRTVKKFAFLFLASAIGFVLFIILSIISDTIIQNPETSSNLVKLFQNPVNDALSLVLSMIFSAMFIIGVIGSVVIVIHNRRRKI